MHMHKVFLEFLVLFTGLAFFDILYLSNLLVYLIKREVPNKIILSGM